MARTVANLWLRVHEGALPPALFARLLRDVQRLGSERLRHTYQTTFWFPLDALPACSPERAIARLRDWVKPAPEIAGVEWWLSRMKATDVQVDFHQDRDERRALGSGREVHPTWSSVLFLNRVRGGALAVTAEPRCDDNPARAPERLDFELAAPRPNRFVVFRGDLTHGVLDANNQIPERRLPGPARLRLALIANWWTQRPLDVPTFGESRAYRSLGFRRAPA